MKFFTLFILLAVSSVCYSDSNVIISPGIKIGIGYQNGIHFSFGGELSVVLMNESLSRYGIVLDYDDVNGIKRFHIGGEYMFSLGGIDIGPTFGWKEKESMTGFSIVPFFGAILLPYYNYTYFNDIPDIHEYGVYIKGFIPTRFEHMIDQSLLRVTEIAKYIKPFIN